MQTINKEPNGANEKILVSACLLGEACRYDGKSKPVPEILKLFKEGRVIPVCPEFDGGLPIPRSPAEQQGDRVVNADGKDVTEEYTRGALHALELCKKHNIKKAILKAKSPSCGVGRVYDGTFSGTLTEGDGVTARLLKENGIEVMDENTYLERGL